MNIFSKFEHLKDLTQNEKVLIDFIKNNPEQFMNMKSSEICKACYISSSSIYRLCNKLGLSGLSELKVQVSASLLNYVSENKEFDYNYPIKPNQTQYQITHKLKDVYTQTIQSTLNYLDLEQLRLAVAHMKKSKHIEIYSSAGNIFFAQNFQFQMQEIGIKVEVPVDEYQQNLTASYSDASHLAIVISFGGRGTNILNILQILKKNKTPILLITAPNSPIEKFGTYVLYMSPHEDHYKKISSFSTRFTLLYILDSLYTCYFETDYDNNIKKKLKHYEIMTEFKGGVK